MKLVSTLLLTLTLAFAIGCKTDEATSTEDAATTAPGAVGTACAVCPGKCTGTCKQDAKADPNMGALGDKYNLPSCGGEKTCPSTGAACPSAGKTCPSGGK